MAASARAARGGLFFSGLERDAASSWCMLRAAAGGLRMQDIEDVAGCRTALLAWYDRHHRQLPWRSHPQRQAPAAAALAPGQAAAAAAAAPASWSACAVDAARKGAVAALRSLVGRGANVHAGDSRGETALMVAISGNQVPALHELLPVSNLTVTNIQGWNALHFCAAFGTDEILKLLLPHVTDLDAATVPGMFSDGTPIGFFKETALHIA